MKRVPVLVTVPLEQAQLDMIATVGPQVEVRYALDEMRVERGLSRQLGLSVHPHVSGGEMTPAQASATLDRLLADTEVIFSWRLPVNILSRTPRLKWLHFTGAGIDTVTKDTGLLESNVLLTGSRGVRTTSVAEFTLCLIMMLAKQSPYLIANQAAHVWKPLIAVKLSGSTLGVVGLGSIGSEVARMGKALNMKVLAIRRSATTHQTGTDGVDEVFPAAELRQMLSRCDFVVLAAPLTAETQGLIGEAELRAMKPTAYLVNIARGALARQDALVRALKEGWIAGAGLDAFETEPLPPESELWALPNAIITPHTAWSSEQGLGAATELFCENLRRYLSGRELLNIIDKKKGY